MGPRLQAIGLPELLEELDDVRMNTLLAGATGFVGNALLPHLDDCVVLSRNPERTRQGLSRPVSMVAWDPLSGPLRSPLLSSDPPHAVINLMGENLAGGRWNAARKRRIWDSRVLGTRHLVESLLELPSLPEVLISASAVGFYGDGGESFLDESSPRGSGFLADLCGEWEEAAQQMAPAGVRVVNLRMGIVLGREGGALESMLPVFRRGLGGRLGSGKQWMPWIHSGDLARLIVWCLRTGFVRGPVNATAPQPERNREFARTLAQTVGRPAWLPVPRLALRIVLGEFANSLLQSQRAVPRVALDGGFGFQYPSLSGALDAILGEKP